MRPHGSPSTLEKRRHKAIELSHKGKQTVEIARAVGATRRTIRRWKALYRLKGIRGLKAVPASGRPIRLGVEQRDKLERILLNGAQVAGFDTDLWTCPRIAEVIRRQFGVRYHVDHIGRLLHSLGWSPQRPQRKAMERDEQKVRSWIKGTWVRIKKNDVTVQRSGVKLPDKCWGFRKSEIGETLRPWEGSRQQAEYQYPERRSSRRIELDPKPSFR